MNANSTFLTVTPLSSSEMKNQVVQAVVAVGVVTIALVLMLVGTVRYAHGKSVIPFVKKGAFSRKSQDAEAGEESYDAAPADAYQKKNEPPMTVMYSTTVVRDFAYTKPQNAQDV